MPGDEEMKQPDEGQSPEAGAEGIPTDGADALDADSPGAEEAVEAASAAAAEVAEEAADPKTPVSNAANDAALAALKAAQAAIASVKSGTFTSDSDGESVSATPDHSPAAKPAAPSNPAPSNGARAARPFTPVEVSPAASRPVPAEVDMLADVNLNVKIELGRTRMFVEDVLKLGEGSVVELDKAAGDPVDVYVNDRRVARGEVLVINDCFCVRVSEILTAASLQD